VVLELTLITRNDCHLCEAAEAALARVLGRLGAELPELGYSAETIDIDQHPDLLARYSDEVPVLLLDGEQVAFWRIDEERVFERIVSQRPI
jgi:glutaredoxin